MLSINEINLLQAQNEGLKKQNAELQKQIKKYAKINEQETKDYAELKAENERLKEKILKFRWDNPYFDLYNNVVNQRDMWEQKSKRYKQTLQKIKEIAEVDVHIVGDEKFYYDVVEQILQKIAECEVNE